MNAIFKTRKEKLIRLILGSSLMLLGINALGGGIYGMMGAEAVPTAWLKGSFLNSYFVPALILFSCVGIPAVLASVAVFKQHSSDRKLSFSSAIITLLWILIQMAIIGYVSWLQPVVLATAVFIFILIIMLPHHDN